jgi:hypothetical protein
MMRWNNEGKTLGFYFERFSNPTSENPDYSQSGSVELEDGTFKITSYYSDAHIEECLMQRQ